MALQTPPLPAQVYQGVTTGPGTSRTYQVQSGVPIDGTRQVLRHPEGGSPFTFRILPPDVLLNAMGGTQEQTEDISIIGAAQRIYNDFPTYLSKIDTFRSDPLVFKGNNDRTRLASLVANNGVQFDPANAGPSMANVLGIADVRQALDAASADG